MHHQVTAPQTSPGPGTGLPPGIAPTMPDQHIDALRAGQNLMLGAAGGLAGTFVGAVIWAAVTAGSGYQVGWMAVGVGLLVGMLTRLLGRGVDRVFGVLGAVLALLGCVLGNVLSGCYFVAEAEGVSYLEALSSLTPSLAVQTITLMFAPADLLFYGIAVYEGYRFSFKRPPEA